MCQEIVDENEIKAEESFLSHHHGRSHIAQDGDKAERRIK